jgi:hypothetical protein
MLLACIGMSWVSVKMQRARKQKEVVEEIKTLGGFVEYDYEVDTAGNRIQGAQPSSPKWLRSLLGDDFFWNVDGVLLVNTQVTDAGLERLKGFTQLQTLFLGNTQVTDAGLEHLKGLTQLQYLLLDNSQVTDAGLENLKGLTQLQWVQLRGTEVTDAGVEKLQRALPNCRIIR